MLSKTMEVLEDCPNKKNWNPPKKNAPAIKMITRKKIRIESKQKRTCYEMFQIFRNIRFRYFLCVIGVPEALRGGNRNFRNVSLLPDQNCGTIRLIFQHFLIFRSSQIFAEKISKNPKLFFANARGSDFLRAN